MTVCYLLGASKGRVRLSIVLTPDKASTLPLVTACCPCFDSPIVCEHSRHLWKSVQRMGMRKIKTEQNTMSHPSLFSCRRWVFYQRDVSSMHMLAYSMFWNMTILVILSQNQQFFFNSIQVRSYHCADKCICKRHLLCLVEKKVCIWLTGLWTEPQRRPTDELLFKWADATTRILSNHPQQNPVPTTATIAAICQNKVSVSFNWPKISKKTVIYKRVKAPQP